MNTEIFLVRHGETEWNIQGKFQGSTDIPLSESGIKQAGYVKKRFENNFDCVYSSPLVRAVKTASILSEGSGIKVNIKEGISEIDFGKWEGLTLKQLKDIYGKEYEEWRNDEVNGYLIGGGDFSLKLAGERAKKAIYEIAEECKGKRVIIVAHGGIIKAALIAIYEWKMTMYGKMIFGNTSVSKLCFREDSNLPELLSMNDLSHLPKEYVSDYFL